ncbi:MAG: trypsin-like peptidase domain-containing protein [bacterium]|nr:trypsin-like peptidase domain-containing protein [bacterium]
MSSLRLSRRFFPLILLAVLAAGSAVLAADAPRASINPLAVQGPVASEFAVKAASAVPSFGAMPVDRAAAQAEDVSRAEADLPPRFALPQVVDLDPETSGTWEDLDSRFTMWRLRLNAPGALSLNLGFTAYRLPKGARLSLYPTDVKGADDPRGVRVFTDRDNEEHGELWTPVVVADDIVVELVLPIESRHDYELAIGSVNRGYAFFGESIERMMQDKAANKAGACNIDVVCPEGDDWRLEINSVGVISTGGSTFCTGAMVNNTAEDGTPYFLTANHCGINTGNAASLVVYWNFQSPTCGAQSGGSLTEFQTGSVFLAASSTSDFTLVRMDDPVDPAHEVSFAGWNKSTQDFPAVTAIHHPNGEEKSISFENNATTTTAYLSNTVVAGGNHIRVTDWDLGTTEPGSSGSPLFDPDHRVVGQLHGGYAACGNNESDWYGRLSTSWSSIASYLDPTASGVTVLDTFAPWATGLQVSGGDFASEGNYGGPFSPASAVYVLTNNNNYPISFSVTDDVAWTDVSGGSGTLSAGGSATVTVSLNLTTNFLVDGLYEGTIAITNTTDGEGSTTRALRLQVGVPVMTLSYPLDTNPGWAVGAGWAYGTPTGAGGQYGEADPTSGYTGSNVLGYNLSGDYPNNRAESHLTTTVLDCSNMRGTTLKFWRWLNVEQPAYDHAYVRVSNDGGATWTQVWTNTAEVADAAWTQVVYDISALVDGQTNVLIRWTMGSTDSSWQYSGWNIDDIELWALPEGSVGIEGPLDDPEEDSLPRPTLGLGQNFPNPFNPSTVIRFELARAEVVSLAVYDMQGHLVRRLAQGAHEPGTYSVVWDGTTDRGDRAASGTYLYRLETSGRIFNRQMTLLK